MSSSHAAVYGLLRSGLSWYTNRHFSAVVLVYTLYGGAYIAEIIRSGIESIPKGQWEAAKCIGLNPVDVLRDVVLPQSFKISLPALIGFHLGLIKIHLLHPSLDILNFYEKGKPS